MKLKNIGMGLIEIMIAVGLLGAASVGVMKLMDFQSKSNLRANTNVEINSAINLIQQALLSDKACEHTLPTGDLRSNTTLNAIRNKADREIYIANGTKYHSNTFSIQSITLIPGDGNSTIANSFDVNGIGELIIKIIFVKEKKVLKQRTVAKVFPIKLEVDSSFILKKCYSSTENAVETAETFTNQEVQKLRNEMITTLKQQIIDETISTFRKTGIPLYKGSDGALTTNRTPDKITRVINQKNTHQDKSSQCRTWGGKSMWRMDSCASKGWSHVKYKVVVVSPLCSPTSDSHGRVCNCSTICEESVAKIPVGNLISP